MIDIPKGLGDESETPPWLFEYWDRIFQFDRDVACTRKNALAPPVLSALEDDWGKRNWLNPPYSNPKPFLERASQEPTLTVALLKFDPSTTWWEFVREAKTTVLPIEKRVRFYYQGQPQRHVAPFPSAIVIFWPKMEMP